MKKINTDLIKDLIISILIVVCIALIISVIFYDSIAVSKVIPQAEKYELSDEMQEDLKKVEADRTKNVVTTYYIDAADLKKYEKTNEYVKGKQNPFAYESADVDGSTTINGNYNNNGSNSTSTNFYEDDGTK